MANRRRNRRSGETAGSTYLAKTGIRLLISAILLGVLTLTKGLVPAAVPAVQKALSHNTDLTPISSAAKRLLPYLKGVPAAPAENGQSSEIPPADGGDEIESIPDGGEKAGAEGEIPAGDADNAA